MAGADANDEDAANTSDSREHISAVSCCFARIQVKYS
jgi:hypothetical protein